MKTPLPVLLCSALALGGCGDSGVNLNPFSWFGGGQQTAIITVVETGAIDDPRPLTAEITAARIEPIPGGAILHAAALPPRQGFWEPVLLVENEGTPEGGVLSFQFRASPSPAGTPSGTAASRRITAGVFLSDQTLQGVRQIVVKSAGNQRTLRP